MLFQDAVRRRPTVAKFKGPFEPEAGQDRAVCLQSQFRKWTLELVQVLLYTTLMTTQVAKDQSQILTSVGVQPLFETGHLSVGNVAAETIRQRCQAVC